MSQSPADKWRQLLEAKKQKSASQTNQKRGTDNLGTPRPAFRKKKGGGLFDR